MSVHIRKRLTMAVVIVVGFLCFVSLGCEDQMLKSNDLENDVFEKDIDIDIYFGHQSVGMNLLDGIKENYKGNFIIIDAEESVSDKENVLNIYHSNIGRNKYPFEKINDYCSVIESDIFDKIDVAVMKFCYIDFNDSTDVEAVYKEYIERITLLEHMYSDVTFLYMTVPIVVREGDFKSIAKRFLGRYTDGREGNVARNSFNERLREEKLGTGRLFDIAYFESTYMNGDRNIFDHKGMIYEALVPEYTHDGGHLNETGRRYIAAEFLYFLYNLDSSWSGILFQN